MSVENPNKAANDSAPVSSDPTDAGLAASDRFCTEALLSSGTMSGVKEGEPKQNEKFDQDQIEFSNPFGNSEDGNWNNPAPEMTDIQLASVGSVEIPGWSNGTPRPAPPREGEPVLVRDESPFTGKFNRTDAENLVLKLGSSEFKDRQFAQRELEKMGPPAVPFLKERLDQEKDGNRDPEVMLRIKSAVDSISSKSDQEEVKKLFTTANDIVPSLKDLYSAAGAEMNSKGSTAFSNEKGEFVRNGPMLSVDSTSSTAISPAQENTFNKVISELDRVNENPMLDKALKALEPHFQSDSENKDKALTAQYFRLAWMQHGGSDAREHFAKALAGQTNPTPAHQARARELLTEVLERGRTPDGDLRRIAIKAGGATDPKFMETWKQHGGQSLDTSVLKRRTN